MPLNQTMQKKLREARYFLWQLYGVAQREVAIADLIPRTAVIGLGDPLEADGRRWHRGGHRSG